MMGHLLAATPWATGLVFSSSGDKRSLCDAADSDLIGSGAALSA